MHRNSYLKSLGLMLLTLTLLPGCGDFFNFSTKPQSTPSVPTTPVASVSPVDGAANVPVDSAITVTFNVEAKLTTFVMKDDSGAQVSGTLTPSTGVSTSFTFSPAQLLPATHYSVTVQAVDSTGSVSSTRTTCSFTTAAATPAPSWSFYQLPGSGTRDMGYFLNMKRSPIDGALYITYYDDSDRALHITSTTDGSSFSGPVTVAISSGGVSAGKDSSLAIDSTGHLHLSFLHEGVGMKYVTAPAASGPWTVTTVDSSARDMASTAMALDINNKVHIVYHDYNANTLRYATNATGEWKTELVDGTSSGSASALQLDDQGHLHIVYTDDANGGLKYVTGTSAAWSTPVTLDVTGQMMFPSLVIRSGKIFCTYYDGLGHIKLATTESGAWATSVVASDAGMSVPSLAIDSNGNLDAAYISGAGSLMYARRAASWVSNAIATGLGQGFFTAIALDASGKASIIYHDAAHNGVGFARQN